MTANELRRELRWARWQAMDAAADGTLDDLRQYSAEVRELSRRLEASR